MHRGGLFRAPDRDGTRRFYDGLVAGDVRRGMWGKDARFSSERILSSDLVRRYYTAVVSGLLAPQDRVLDLGCGTGGFLAVTAPFCHSITGVDVTPAFVRATRELIGQRGINNAEGVLGSGTALPFADGSFDAVVMVYVLHHLADVSGTLADVRRVLRPGGKLIAFEPNKLNPLLFLLHLVDRNEWGLLSLGRPGRYREVVGRHFTIETLAFSGLVVGPQSPVYAAAADFLAKGWGRHFLSWLCPKLYFVARR